MKWRRRLERERRETRESRKRRGIRENCLRRRKTRETGPEALPSSHRSTTGLRVKKEIRRDQRTSTDLCWELREDSSLLRRRRDLVL